MLIIDKSAALLIALFFGFSGLPAAFWLLRKEKNMLWFEKAVVGCAFGFVLVPLLFFIESLAGIYFSQPLIFVNWAVVFFGGLFLLVREKGWQSGIIPNFAPSLSWASPLSLLAIMSAIFLIGASTAGIIIFELDPYYYAEGVRQVVYEGHNYLNDQTAWFPTTLSSHLGTPLFKYLLASWASLYMGSQPYDPYTFALSIALYPPIIGALSAFFAYLLFSSFYSRRVGVLAAGVLSFMPVMLIKFQGGDLQVEPMNVFGLLFFFWAVLQSLKMAGLSSPAVAAAHAKGIAGQVAQYAQTLKSSLLANMGALAIFGLGYSMVVLGTNLGSLVVFTFSVFMFLLGLSCLYSHGHESSKLRAFTVLVLALMALVQCVMLLYFQYPLATLGGLADGLSSLFRGVGLPAAAFLIPWAFDFALSKARISLSGPAKVGTLALFGLFAVFIIPSLPVISDLMQSYLIFGAYPAPLYRTIAEQAPGTAYYASQFGFVAAPLAPIANPSGDIAVALVSAASWVPSILGSVSTFVVNFLYSLFVWFMNNIVHSNFEFIEKGNSLLTFFLFSGTLLLAIRLASSAYKKAEWPVHALLLISFIVPVALVGFGKQKLSMFLAVALLFALSSFWGEAERLFSSRALPYLKKRYGEAHAAASNFNWRYVSAFAIAVVVLAQFGTPAIFSFQLPGTTPGPLATALSSSDYGLNSQVLLFNSLTPRVYDNPQAAYEGLKSYCAQVPQDTQVCDALANWNQTLSNPVALYNYYLCSRSLWPTPGQAPAEMGYVFSYRCSAITGYWLEAMEWIRIDSNVMPEDRVISWWDYGHWINFFGEKRTVLRNEHASDEMIGRTAYSYLHGTPAELRATMAEYGSRTAIFDSEILGSPTADGFQLGGKYDALNYLGCAWANETDVSRTQRQSACEVNNLWEQIVVPTTQAQQQACTISESSGLVGVVAYSYDFPLPGQQMSPQPKYCITDGYIGGRQMLITYRLGDKDSNGDLRMQRASWQYSSADQSNAILTAFYTKELIWPNAEGALSSGWDDRTTNFYDSNAYSAFFLGQLEGFRLAYSTPYIKIYKLE